MSNIIKSFKALQISSKLVTTSKQIQVTQIFQQNFFSTEKHDVQPKRPLSGYQEFIKENYKKVQAENPQIEKGKKAAETIKKLAVMWNSMKGRNEIEVYLNKSKEDSERYKKTVEEFNQKMTPEEAKTYKKILREERSNRRKYLSKHRIKRERKQLGKPARAPGAFFLYSETLDKGEAKITEFQRGAAIKWKMLPEDEKEKYFKKSAEQMEEYKEKLKAWEDKMILEGKEKLIYKTHLSGIKRKEKRNLQSLLNVKTRLLRNTMKKASKIKKNQRKSKSSSSDSSDSDKDVKNQKK